MVKGLKELLIHTRARVIVFIAYMYIHLRGEGEQSKVQNISVLTITIVILHSITPVLPSYFIYYTVIPFI